MAFNLKNVLGIVFPSCCLPFKHIHFKTEIPRILLLISSYYKVANCSTILKKKPHTLEMYINTSINKGKKML